MRKNLLAFLLLLLPSISLAQSSISPSPYQAATITQVKLHEPGEAIAPPEAVYEVTVKVNGTTYVVLTKSPSGDQTILYAIGREVLVRVGDKTITWNDILGQSHEVPIISTGPIADGSKSQN